MGGRQGWEVDSFHTHPARRLLDVLELEDHSDGDAHRQPDQRHGQAEATQPTEADAEPHLRQRRLLLLLAALAEEAADVLRESQPALLRPPATRPSIGLPSESFPPSPSPFCRRRRAAAGRCCCCSGQTCLSTHYWPLGGDDAGNRAPFFFSSQFGGALFKVAAMHWPRRVGGSLEGERRKLQQHVDVRDLGVKFLLVKMRRLSACSLCALSTSPCVQSGSHIPPSCVSAEASRGRSFTSGLGERSAICSSRAAQTPLSVSRLAGLICRSDGGGADA